MSKFGKELIASLQQAAARALLGQIDINGRLPISLPGLYPRGTGIKSKASSTSIIAPTLVRSNP